MSPDDEWVDDLCRAGGGASGARALGFVLLFVVLFTCGTDAMLSDAPVVRIAAASLAYTAGVIIYSFARNRNGVPRYLFTCPTVVAQYPRLLKRHAAFLAAEIAFLAIALRFFPLPPAGASRSEDGSGLLVVIPLAALALTEIFTNRAVLDRAHNDRLGDPPDTADSERDRPISLFGRSE